jgi:tetratricopeptide (TPR) repeat protein
VRRVAGVLVALLVLAGCGGGGVRKMESAFESGDYAEVVGLSRLALRNGDDRPVIHYYYGAGLVGMGRDHEGFTELERAIAEDSNLSAQAAAFLWEQAQARPRTQTSARRMRMASQFDPTIDLGPYGFAVANVCLAERSYADAARLYQQAIAAYPDTSACEDAYARLAECWAELNEPEKAQAAMETLVEKYPRGSLAGRAGARLNDISFDQAQAAYDAGDYEQSLELAQELVETTANRSLQQKARFLLGESYEATGDAAGAYGAYNEIIRSDRGDSGRVVERARARIAALQEAGLR